MLPREFSHIPSLLRPSLPSDLYLSTYLYVLVKHRCESLRDLLCERCGREADTAQGEAESCTPSAINHVMYERETHCWEVIVLHRLSNYQVTHQIEAFSTQCCSRERLAGTSPQQRKASWNNGAFDLYGFSSTTTYTYLYLPTYTYLPTYLSTQFESFLRICSMRFFMEKKHGMMVMHIIVEV